MFPPDEATIIKFKTGDKVRCIRPFHATKGEGSSLLLGQHYEVASAYLTTVHLVGNTGNWSIDRFEHVIELPAETTALIDADMAARLTTTADKDPNGVDAHQPGAKLDAGKQRPALVLGAFAPALAEVVKVGTFGAAKYTDNGWLEVPNGYARYSDAQMRHQMAHTMGQAFDAESKLLHLAHEAWNSLAKLTLYLNNVKETSCSTK